MGDRRLKGIEDTQNVLVTTFLAVVTILVISTPVTFLPFKIAYAAYTFSWTDIDFGLDSASSQIGV